MLHGAYSVYIIYNSSKYKYYIGFTSNLYKRLLRHNKVLPSKRSSFTARQSGIWTLIYKEEFTNVLEARKREKWFKSGIGRNLVKENLSYWIKKAQG